MLIPVCPTSPASADEAQNAAVANAKKAAAELGALSAEDRAEVEKLVSDYVQGMELGAYGQHQGPGEVTKKPIPADVVTARTQGQQQAATSLAVGEPKQILFGDLHVHTTFSTDAFRLSLPLMQGEGAHPIADACDYARFCSALDFWSINDHAEAYTSQKWQETKDTIRQCNAVAGDPDNPDVAAFLGFEWTQMGLTPDDHYGHKNVIFQDLADDKVPARPIGAAGVATDAVRGAFGRIGFATPLLDFANRQVYFNLPSSCAKFRPCPCARTVSTHGNWAPIVTSQRRPRGSCSTSWTSGALIRL